MKLGSSHDFNLLKLHHFLPDYCTPARTWWKPVWIWYAISQRSLFLLTWRVQAKLIWKGAKRQKLDYSRQQKYFPFCIKNLPKIESIGRSAVNLIGFFWKSFTTSRSVEGSSLCYIVLFSIVFFFRKNKRTKQNWKTHENVQNQNIESRL